MDESFLSQPKVIKASRRFVCIRLATYEDKQEAELLKKLFIGRSGELENTTFAMLSPDGTRRLTRTGRSPDFAFGRSGNAKSDMAAAMNRIADEHKSTATQPSHIPKMADVRLALNVASCDNQPLLVVFNKDKSALRAMESKLALHAWDANHVGQFIYASTNDPRDLKFIEGVSVKSGVVAIQPGQFGLSGMVLGQVGDSANKQEINKMLTRAASEYRVWRKSSSEHISSGRSKGISWETLLPITDPGGSRR